MELTRMVYLEVARDSFCSLLRNRRWSDALTLLRSTPLEYKNALVTYQDSAGASPLILLCQSREVRWNDTPNAVEDDYLTNLATGVLDDLFEELVTSGAATTINHIDNDGGSAIGYALTSKNRLFFWKLLSRFSGPRAKVKLDLDQSTPRSQTLLAAAIGHRDMEAAAHLISAGVNLNLMHPHDSCPVICLALRYPVLVKMMIRAGAELHYCDQNGVRTSVLRYAFYDHPNVRTESIRLLMNEISTGKLEWDQTLDHPNEAFRALDRSFQDLSLQATNMWSDFQYDARNLVHACLRLHVPKDIVVILFHYCNWLLPDPKTPLPRQVSSHPLLSEFIERRYRDCVVAGVRRK